MRAAVVERFAGRIREGFPSRDPATPRESALLAVIGAARSFDRSALPEWARGELDEALKPPLCLDGDGRLGWCRGYCKSHYQSRWVAGEFGGKE